MWIITKEIALNAQVIQKNTIGTHESMTIYATDGGYAPFLKINSEETDIDALYNMIVDAIARGNHSLDLSEYKWST